MISNRVKALLFCVLANTMVVHAGEQNNPLKTAAPEKTEQPQAAFAEKENEVTKITPATINPSDVPSTDVTKLKTVVHKIPDALHKAGNYIVSKEGVKDSLGAYCLGMGLTAIHELAHAVTGRLAYGAKAPINLTLGTQDQFAVPYLKLGGIKLSGFDPATGFARIPRELSLGAAYSRKKDILITIAGPIAGALASLGAKMIFKNHPIMNLVAAYGLFNHTIGVAGIGGLLIPNSDADQLRKLLSKRS